MTSTKIMNSGFHVGTFYENHPYKHYWKMKDFVPEEKVCWKKSL